MTSGDQSGDGTPDLRDPQARPRTVEPGALIGVVRALLLFFATLGAAIWIPGVATRPAVSTLALAGVATPFLFALALARAGRPVAASRIAVANVAAAAIVSTACFGGLRGPVVFSLPLSISIIGLLRGRSAAVAAGVIELVSVLALSALERAGVAPLLVPALTPRAAALSVLGGIGVAVALIAFYTREVGRARRDAEASTARAIASEQELADLVRSSPDGIAVLDADGVIRLANDAMAQIAGCPAARLVERELPDLPGMGELENRESVLEGLARLHEGGEAFWELNLPQAEGRPRPAEIHARRVVRPDGSRKVLLVVRDLSFRAEAEEARARLESELREARRLEGLGRLAGGVAHDFRNLLTPILVNTGLIEQEGGLPHAARELVREIALAAERSNGLTQQLLAFARRQSLELRPLDLNEILREMEPLLRRLVRADISLDVSLSPRPAALLGDRTPLEQVIVNLVANARDAIEGPGAIRIVTATTLAEPGGAERVELSVTDDGGGMTEQVRSRLFEPFFSTKGPDGGTGLGLATVHGIVAQLGGSIDVRSAPGRGTAFRILFPRLAELEAPGTIPPPAPASGARPARILLVDDDDLVRAVVARTLRSAGHLVTAVQAGAEAIDLGSAAAAPFDLLVTDVVMPSPTGPEVARALCARNACRSVLFVSGYAERPEPRDPCLGRRNGFLQKPFSRETLLTAVDALLAA